ncbi:hypothetical protein MSAN_00308800 [Mycena sanguinolenta]|uniref:Uncharacterized protein n=1 Tax=Mycena sanguinolenta TaxID=230812 RepID=A0A8H7DG75_9AGAR|nr:hypothetical protein MSAN_00308800 [Mycena sanguinolenta]
MLDSVFSSTAPPPFIPIEAREEWLSSSNWVERLHSLHRAAVRLDALRDSAHVGSVHSWNFSAGKFRLPSTAYVQHIGLITVTYARLLKTFSTTLRLYHNLRSLRLEAFVIDAPFRQTLSELVRLDNLALYGCDIVARNGFVISLRSFTISAEDSMACIAKEPREPIRLASPESLHTLHLGAPGETPSLLTAFRRAQYSHLTTLLLERLSDLEMFLAFLTQCPGLEVLKITTVDPDIIVSLLQYTLSPETIPALRDLTVRQEILGFFSSNRPIDTVTILGSLASTHASSPIGHFPPTILNDLLKASVPLISLSIPETSPTLELLTAITSLFPQLKQLSIRLTQPTLFRRSLTRCCRGCEVSVDKRCPILRDADVFRDIPQDDLSDAEDEKPPPSMTLVRIPKELEISSLTNFHKIVNWICTGAGSLPQSIEVLRFLWDEDCYVPDFSREREHQVIATLTHLYAHLRKFQRGPSWLWTREGAVWRQIGTDSYIQAVL